MVKPSMSEFRVSSLIPTQNGIRSFDRVLNMVDHIKQGGVLDRESLESLHGPDDYAPMKLRTFPDGKIYIHDGHHRALSIYRAGRDYLYKEEYELEYWNNPYLYDEVNFSAGWVTPFNLMTEIRYPNVLPFKKTVFKIAKVSKELARIYIFTFRHKYCTDRKGIRFVGDLYNAAFTESQSAR